MKFTTTAAAALAATGASAQWEDWSSTTTTTTTTTSKVLDPAKASSTSWEDWTTTSTTSKVIDPATASSTLSWEDWSSSSTSKKSTSKVVDGAKTSSSTTPAWTCPASTVTKTETSTAWAGTTTVYRSTVFVGPGPASTTTVYASTCPAAVNAAATSSTKPGTWGPAGSSTAGAAGTSSTAWGSSVAGAAGTSSSDWGSAKAGASTAGAAGTSDWGTTTTYGSTQTKTVTVSPSAAATTGWPAGDWTSLDPGVDGTIVSTGGWDWTAPPVADPTSTAAAPTYTGWGDWNGTSGSGGSGVNGTGPEPGSSASNVTKPMGPLKDTGCNTAGDRSKWCDGRNIDTDYYAAEYSTGKYCTFSLTITNTTLNLDGVDRPSHAINGQVPGPLIECNWGDWVVVTVSNEMTDEPTSIHWHGITQKGTNDQDGVPGVTECAIAPGSSRVYKFKANQYGTGWYHSHVLTQYGDGIRGPLVIHGPATANYDIDMGTVMIDDNFGNATNPNTAKAQNVIIAHTGPKPSFNYLLNGANTLPDNSAGKHAYWSVQPGKKHLFRIINSASQNMWSVHFDNHKMTVISADWVPITPYTTEWLNIGIGQRYDVIVEMDQPTAGYFLRAVAQTGCPSGSTNTGLGTANGIFTYKGADLTLPSSTAGNKTVADFAFCKDEPITSLVPHLKKGAGSSSAFQASASTLPAGNVAQVNTTDDGTVFRWFLNNGGIQVNYTQPTLQSLANGVSTNSSVYSNPIVLTVKNQWVYFVIQNQFFASHPIHLHGHDLSLLGQGSVSWSPALTSTLNFDNPPRRDTAMLTGSKGPGFPAGYTVIGFETDNPGAWLMHCHIVWHVDGGLALQWIERPSDIKSYGSGAEFKSECAAEVAFEATGPTYRKTSESGLKRRTYMDELLDARSDNVVRHADSAEKRYIDSYVKRGLGDGYKPRHGARR